MSNPADKVERWSIDRLVPYANKAKAIKRLKGMADPTKFTIGEVCVMPKDLMMRLLDAIPGGHLSKVA